MVTVIDLGLCSSSSYMFRLREFEFSDGRPSSYSITCYSAWLCHTQWIFEIFKKSMIEGESRCVRSVKSLLMESLDAHHLRDRNSLFSTEIMEFDQLSMLSLLSVICSVLCKLLRDIWLNRPLVLWSSCFNGTLFYVPSQMLKFVNFKA